MVTAADATDFYFDMHVPHSLPHVGGGRGGVAVVREWPIIS